MIVDLAESMMRNADTSYIQFSQLYPPDRVAVSIHHCVDSIENLHLEAVYKSKNCKVSYTSHEASWRECGVYGFPKS